MSEVPSAMEHFEMSITLPSDEDGFTGRECPDTPCKGYFKVTLGTGLAGIDDCFCPYCGHRADANSFATADQIAYAKSVALNKITLDLIDAMKAMEFNLPAHGPFGIGMSVTVTGTPVPIRNYREKQLETMVQCDRCTLRYAIYGVFAYCPDCGVHNSLQILDKNLELAGKEGALAGMVELELAGKLIADALENEVASFDGFGREACRVYAPSAAGSRKAVKISFQNLSDARTKLMQHFNVDLAAAVTAAEWDFACRCFQKRHLLAHTMGVVDEDYLRKTNDPSAILGRKISISSDEIALLSTILRRLGAYLIRQLEASETRRAADYGESSHDPSA